jgi:hypothetical protein
VKKANVNTFLKQVQFNEPPPAKWFPASCQAQYKHFTQEFWPSH